MKLIETPVGGAFVIEPDVIPDIRGFFARGFDQREFGRAGLCDRWVQANFSWNRLRGTLRGMHYQEAPHREVKLVACTRGAIYDVMLDLRQDSPSRHRWTAVELTEANHLMLYIPEGVAHGFQTLQDGTMVHYEISEFYHPESARGVRWNDPMFRIAWPLPEPILSDKDRTVPDHQE